MTTIAYRDGIIATDGQVTAGDVIVFLDEIKREEKDCVAFFLCGSEDEREELMDAWPEGKVSKDCNAGGFAINQGVLLGCCANNGRVSTWSHPRSANWAFGSGEQFAIGAMDAGLTAADAIAVASNRDVATGGTIRTYCARTGEEI